MPAHARRADSTGGSLLTQKTLIVDDEPNLVIPHRIHYAARA
jgi:hypothetical protein